MTLLLHDIVLDYLPINRRQNNKGWISFNAPCCHHRGHKPDTRGRGNFLMSPDGSMIANCYNCGFKASYKGGDLTYIFEAWLRYLGVPQEKIQKAKLEILSKKLNGELETIEPVEWFKTDYFPEIELPPESKLISELKHANCQHQDFLECVNYLESRGRAVADSWDYYWCPSITGKKTDISKRIIIPFKNQDRIVGWTGRYCGKPPSWSSRYHNSDIPQGYLFNGDVISTKHRKFIIIVEGPLDAISLDCVGALGSTLNRNQVAWLNSNDKEKIVLPDRQAKNQGLIDIALENHWSVSFPEWDEKIKDAADASKKYGKLYTLASVIAAKTNSQLKIGVNRQMLKG